MSTEIDFRSLWNKQPAAALPDSKEIFAKASRLKKRTIFTLLVQNVVLIISSVIITYVGWNMKGAKLITQIGVIMMLAGIISYLIVYNQIMPTALRSTVGNSSYDYLNDLIRIKRKEEFINKIMANIYFGLLSVGLFLFMLQASAKMSEIGKACYFIITFVCMAIAWFYLQPRIVRKRRKALNEVISRLEELNKQLDEK